MSKNTFSEEDHLTGAQCDRLAKAETADHLSRQERATLGGSKTGSPAPRRQNSDRDRSKEE